MGDLSPSQWPGKTMGIVVTILLAAVALDVAARLLAAAAPILLAVALVFLAAYVAWIWHQRRRGGW
jgi:hypothetical protein